MDATYRDKTGEISMSNNSTYGRRQFLGQITALGAFGYSPLSTSGTSNSPEEEVTNASAEHGHLIELRQSTTAFCNINEFKHYRERLLTCSLNPWLRSCQFGDSPIQFEALVEMKRISGEIKIITLLEYKEYSDINQMNSEGDLTFLEWLATFQPATRDDFLMALPLYRWHQRTGEIVATLNATPDPWLDALLKNTRGILFWSYQWRELIRMVGHVGISHATRLYSDYLLNRAGALDSVRQAQYVSTGQTLLQIIEERSVRGLYAGSPEYVLGDWLHQYYGRRI